MKCSSILSLLVAITFTGCGDESAADSRSQRTRKDRGEAAMTLGTSQWQASSAKATLANGKLTLRASAMQMTDGKASRQELQLQLADFHGLGDYETTGGSRFIAVGIDVDAATAAADEEAAAAKAAALTLSKAKHMMLSGALVTVAAASDTEISGTFSWQPPKGLDQPAITAGTFRALVDQ